MTKTVPSHVVAALKRYDRDLRLRFSNERKCWVLERKCERKYLTPPVRFSRRDYGVVEIPLASDSDLAIEYRDGYTFIFETFEPSERLVRALWETDTRRIGKEFVKKLANQWKVDEQKKRRDRISGFEDMAGDTHDSMMWRRGSRMTAPGVAA